MKFGNKILKPVISNDQKIHSVTRMKTFGVKCLTSPFGLRLNVIKNACSLTTRK